MAKLLISFFLMLSFSAFSSELCTIGYISKAGHVTQHGTHKASLEKCLEYANQATKVMNANGSSSTLVLQHPGIGDSQILMKVENKKDLLSLEYFDENNQECLKSHNATVRDNSKSNIESKKIFKTNSSSVGQQ
jgi:hypothetical protein